jgi:hypothetical protein
MEKPELYSLLKQFNAIGGMAEIGQPGFCLLMALWQKSNELNWANQFAMTNTELLYRSGYNSEKALIEKRNRMMQLGYFKYVSPKNRRSCGMYHLNFDLVDNYFLKHSSEESIPESSDRNSEVSSEVNSDRNSEGNSGVNTNKTKRTKPIKKYIYSPVHMELAQFLLEKIRENKPDYKDPNLESWADTFRLMMEADNRSTDIIRQVIVWCQKDDFWRCNILSAGKLREKFDALELKMNQRKTSPPNAQQSGLNYLKQKIHGNGG